jgi:hypothetical protein
LWLRFCFTFGERGHTLSRSLKTGFPFHGRASRESRAEPAPLSRAGRGGLKDRLGKVSHFIGISPIGTSPGQNDGCHAKADGRGQRQAKQDRPHVTLRLLTGRGTFSAKSEGLARAAEGWA